MKRQTKNRLANKQAKRQSKTDPTHAVFADHLSELRRRLLVVFLFLLAGAGLAYTYRQELLAIILAPLKGQQLVYLTPGGGFTFIFQLSIYAGLIVALPAAVYQLHSFIKPALPVKAQKSVRSITLLASALIIGGVSYGYFVAIPAAIEFLNTFAEGSVSPNLTASSYLSFFLAYIGGLALLSLIPLLLMFWHWINPQTPGQILKSEQYVLVAAFVLAAIITPTPDVLNQAMIAVPIIIVYQIGVVAVLVSIARARRLPRLNEMHEPLPVTLPTTAIPVPAPDPMPPTPVGHSSPSPRAVDGVTSTRQRSRQPRSLHTANANFRQPSPSLPPRRLSLDGMMK